MIKWPFLFYNILFPAKTYYSYMKLTGKAVIRETLVISVIAVVSAFTGFSLIGRKFFLNDPVEVQFQDSYLIVQPLTFFFPFFLVLVFLTYLIKEGFHSYQRPFPNIVFGISAILITVMVTVVMVKLSKFIMMEKRWAEILGDGHKSDRASFVKIVQILAVLQLFFISSAIVIFIMISRYFSGYQLPDKQ